MRMDFWSALWWGLAVVGGGAALYGLHRLGLWLEQRGWLYYRHRKSGGSAAGCFIALQEFIEPPVRHVRQIKEEKRRPAEEEAGGQGEPSAAKGDGPGTNDGRKPA
jgi:hypothetical protein